MVGLHPRQQNIKLKTLQITRMMATFRTDWPSKVHYYIKVHYLNIHSKDYSSEGQFYVVRVNFFKLFLITLLTIIQVGVMGKREGSTRTKVSF